MSCRHALFAVALVISMAPLWAQEEIPIQRGKIAKVDPQAGTVTILVEGQPPFDRLRAAPSMVEGPQTFVVSERTRLMSAENTPLQGLNDPALKEGTAVMFKPMSREPNAVLWGLKIIGANGARGPQEKIKPVDTSKLKALTELGTGMYQGFQGGLYPDGKNQCPARHEQAGLALARQVQPLDEEGHPNPNGKIVLMSVGMSNTTMEFSTFKRLADADPAKNPKLVLVDGAQGGMTAFRIQNADDGASGAKYWGTVDDRLKAAGVTRAQVQVAWIKQANAGPAEGFPAYAKTLQEQLAKIAQLLHTRFPNLKLAYLSSRIYGGYATTRLNPEPYAYEGGFSVKWLIAQQIDGDPALNFDPQKGPVRAPWLAWGPYIWANGAAKNPDGRSAASQLAGAPLRPGIPRAANDLAAPGSLSYEPDDLRENDRTHPSPSGQRKVAERLLNFLKTDSTAKSWFARP